MLGTMQRRSCVMPEFEQELQLHLQLDEQQLEVKHSLGWTGATVQGRKSW